MMKRNIGVTIDVESDWGGRVSQCCGIKYGLPYILGLLRDLAIKATFFISAVVIEKHKRIISEISESGHEIASHSFTHENHSILAEKELFENIYRSKKIIEDTIGIEPVGFRAPQFRLSKKLFDILSDLDFRYDSSMVRSVFPSRYFGLSVPKEPFLLGNGLLEIPVSSLPYIKIPFGLRWINLLGSDVFKLLSKTQTLPENIIFYLHPFDVLDKKDHPVYEGGAGNFITRKWYEHKAHTVKKVLREVLVHWKEKGGTFMLLKDMCTDAKQGG